MKEYNRFLFFDLASTMGYAFLEGEEACSGTETFKLDPLRASDKKKLTPWQLMKYGLWEDGRRFELFTHSLANMLQDFNPDIVGFETPNHRGGPSTRMCVGFASRVIEQCSARSIDLATIAPLSLKLFATGYGNADKEKMKDAAEAWFDHYDRKRDGKIGDGGDEADALCGAMWLRETCLNPLAYNTKVAARNETKKIARARKNARKTT